MKVVKPNILEQVCISLEPPFSSKTVYIPAVEVEDGSIIPYTEGGVLKEFEFQEDAKSLADAYFKELPINMLIDN